MSKRILKFIAKALTMAAMATLPLAQAELSISLPEALTNKTPSNEWNMSQAQFQSAVKTSCGDVAIKGAFNGMSQILGGTQLGLGNSGMMNGVQCPFSTGVGPDTVCPGTDQFNYNPSMLSCPMLRAGGPAQIKQIQNMANSAMCTVMCEKNKLAAVQNEITCLKSIALQLMAQAASLSKQFINFIHTFQLQVRQYKMMADDDDKKAAYIDTKVVPIQKLREGTTALVNSQMPADLLNIQNLNTNIKNAKTTNAEMMQAGIMAEAMDCFKNDAKISNFKCSPNSLETVSAYEMLRCRYQQEANLGTNRKIEFNATFKAQADSKTASLTSALDKMLSDAPSIMGFPKTPEEMAKYNDQKFRITSLSDVQTHYKRALQGHKVGGVDAWQFVNNQVTNCYNYAAQNMAAKQSRVSSVIGQAEQAIAQQKRMMTGTVTTMLNSYSSHMAQIQSTLGEVNIPYDTHPCINSSGDAQVTCIKDLQYKMQLTLTGNAAMKYEIVIKGNNPGTYTKLTCYGLNGCANDLQKEQLRVVSHKQQVLTVQGTYVQQANQQLDQYAQHYGQMLSNQNTMIQTKFQALSGALGSLKCGGIRLPPIKAEAPEMDEDGLYKAPKDPAAFVNRYVSPPLSDLSDDSFSTGLRCLGQQEGDLNQKLSRIQSAQFEIQNASGRCNAEMSQQVVDNVSNQMGNAQNCFDHEVCQDDKQKDLMQTIARIGSSPGMNYGSMAALQSGLSTACQSPYSGQAPWDDPTKTKTERDELKARHFQMNAARGCQAFKASLLSADKILNSYSTGGRRPPGAARAAEAR